MARIRNPKSKISYGGLGLTKEEDKKLIIMLKKTDMSLARLRRELIRQWMETNKIWLLKKKCLK